jgi:hypothetical protein
VPLIKICGPLLVFPMDRIVTAQEILYAEMRMIMEFTINLLVMVIMLSF